MNFNGSNAAEKIDVSANGSRVRLFRDVAAITMDFDGIETLNIRALGSADTVTFDDLTGTDLDDGERRPRGHAGGAGDAQADTVIADGDQRSRPRQRHAVRLAGAGQGAAGTARHHR